MGIISVFTACFGIVFGIVGVVFGTIALNGMKKSGNTEGRGMAITGIVLGLIGSIGWTLFYILFFAFVANQRGFR